MATTSQKERTFDTFDDFAGNYRQIHNQNIKLSGADSDYFTEYRIKEILRRERSNATITEKPIRILDIGSGDGNTARFFKKYFPQSHITGLEITEKVVESAKSRNLPDAEFLLYDGLHIPFGDHHFDMVFMVGTLHHVDRQYHLQLMSEACRVMKPQGVLYNFEHNPWNPVTQKLVRDCVFDKDAVLVSEPYMKRLHREAGYVRIRSTFTLFFPRFSWLGPLIALEPWLGGIPIGGQYYLRAFKTS